MESHITIQRNVKKKKKRAREKREQKNGATGRKQTRDQI